MYFERRSPETDPEELLWLVTTADAGKILWPQSHALFLVWQCAHPYEITSVMRRVRTIERTAGR